jgi:nucleoside-diphosphate-sugar epimerase
MNVLVLGGTRYFGRRLVEQLLKRGHEVTVASRHALTSTFEGSPTRVELSRDDAQAMHAQFSGRTYDVVVDQICMTPHQAKLAVDVFRSIAARYVMTSTISVYDPDGTKLREDAFDPRQAPIPTGTALDYQAGKRGAESVFTQNAPFPVALVRVPMVLGEDDFTGRLEQHVAAVVRSERIVFHRTCEPLSMISSTNMGGFMSWVVEHDLVGPINAGSDGALTGLDVVRMTETLLGGAARIERSDDESDPQFSPYSCPVSFTVDTTRAKDLGYAFDPVESWLPDAIRTIGARLRADV